MAVRNQLAYTFGALFFIALGGGLFGKGLAGYLNNNGIKEPVPLIEISPISHDFGNLGEGTTTNRSSPGTTLGNSTWKSVAAGAKTTLGIAD